jgi:hypothetical protein
MESFIYPTPHLRGYFFTLLKFAGLYYFIEVTYTKQWLVQF